MKKKRVCLCLVNTHECSPYNNYSSNDIYMLTWTHNKTQQPYLSGRACGVQHDDTSLVDAAVLCAHFALSPRPSLF